MFRRFSGGRRSVPTGRSCLFGAGGAHLNLGPSEALHLRLICLHHGGCRCVRWGQRPEFGSSYLAVKVRAPLMVPRPRRSVTVPSQGQHPRRAAPEAGSPQPALRVLAGRGIRLQEVGWVVIDLNKPSHGSLQFLTFFGGGEDKTRKPHNTYCISPVCRGSRILYPEACQLPAPGGRSLGLWLASWFLRVTAGLAGSRQ